MNRRGRGDDQVSIADQLSTQLGIGIELGGLVDDLVGNRYDLAYPAERFEAPQFSAGLRSFQSTQDLKPGDEGELELAELEQIVIGVGGPPRCGPASPPRGYRCPAGSAARILSSVP
jgi:hypothetical protein